MAAPLLSAPLLSPKGGTKVVSKGRVGPEQPHHAGPWVVADRHPRREEAPQPRPGDAVVQLHVLAGVEVLVEQPDALP